MGFRAPSAMTVQPMTQDHRILTVLVGSQAHGLAGPASDVDYRSVFVVPTADLFRVSSKLSDTRMEKGLDDDTSWEVGRFLFLALQCHPLILETFLAPIVGMDAWGAALRELFPSVWDARTAYDAFLGYCLNQRKKFLDKKDRRQEKYAAAYLRVLHNLCELLETGRFTVRIADTRFGETMARVTRGMVRPGEVIDLGEQLREDAARRLARCQHMADLPSVDEYLIRIRKAFLS